MFVTVGRTELLPLVVGTCLISWILRARKGRLGRTAVLWSGLFAVASVLGLFILFSVLRGVDDSHDATAELIAYTIASYNRLSALLSGVLRYPYGGSGIYISPFASYNSSLHRIIPLGEMLHWHSYQEVWLSEFAAQSQAGLNINAIWAGAFGYLYSDLGWGTPLFIVLYGILAGGLWRSIRRGGLLGVVMYPWCAFCILFWHGTNLLLDVKFVVLLVVCGGLAVYERSTMRPQRTRR